MGMGVSRRASVNLGFELVPQPHRLGLALLLLQQKVRSDVRPVKVLLSSLAYQRRKVGITADVVHCWTVAGARARGRPGARARAVTRDLLHVGVLQLPLAASALVALAHPVALHI